MESPRCAKAVKIYWHLGRFAIALTFVWAGAEKLRDPYAFATSVERYQILGVSAAEGVAFLLPWLEILAAVCLLVQRWVGGAMLVMVSLLVVFIAAMISALLRGLNITCGCLGSSVDGSLRVSLLRAVAMLAIALMLVGASRSRRREVPSSG